MIEKADVLLAIQRHQPGITSARYSEYPLPLPELRPWRIAPLRFAGRLLSVEKYAIAGNLPCRPVVARLHMRDIAGFKQFQGYGLRASQGEHEKSGE